MNPSLNFQVVNVLCHVHQENIFVLQLFDESVTKSRLVVSCQELFGKCQESCWTLLEIRNLENSLRIRQLVSLKFAI